MMRTLAWCRRRASMLTAVLCSGRKRPHCSKSRALTSGGRSMFRVEQFGARAHPLKDVVKRRGMGTVVEIAHRDLVVPA